jgi:pyruvate carboxylase subunit B
MVSTGCKVPLRVTDVTLRDGQQSLIATRMRTSDMEEIAADMEKVGFHSMEVWGGATFDVALRFLNEDPWERPRILKKILPSTPLQMLLRGQNLVGYRHYADDVVIEFVKQAAEAGIDIFRVFDALNDERNLETSVKAIKECGKHAQLCICYSLTGPKMGGTIYNLGYYINKAHILEDMGADSICIKDMAGLLAPDDAYTLVSALKKQLKVPLQLHTHSSSGMAMMTCLKAIEAGVDIVDTALAPFAMRSAAPAVEPIVAVLSGTTRDTGLSLRSLLKLSQYAEESIAPKYREFITETHLSTIDTGVLVHQIPGGMISNLLLQMKQMNALDRLEEVYEEMPRVRKDLGYPPLVTPTSQIVGVQALYNVLFGRYKQITTQLQDYCYGLYGKPPAPIDPEIQRVVLKSYKKGKTPTTSRPADLLEPEMEKARVAIKEISHDTIDVLTYALYSVSGLQFLKRKHGLT